MSPNLYDLLDVDEAATPDQIRTAWKSAIADLDPTDRRFRAFNDAAGVLLDPDKRAAYDAELAEARADEDRHSEPVDDEPEDDQPEADQPDAAPVLVPDADVPDADVPDADVPDADLPAEARTGEDADAAAPAPAGPPGWALGAAAVAAVLSVALAVWVLATPGVRVDAADSPGAIAERAVVQERAALAAEQAAEQMVGPVLSYNHKTMAEDLERIRGNMTDKLGEKQAASWPDITKEAEEQQIVVEAAATGAALTRVASDGERATVVVFVDQQVQKKDAEPFVLRMWATMSLVKASGSEGRWLLDDICTDDSCG
ncbi:J domain-containing protein [Nocardioides vastitatis]|uniref:J domain-containing protein n=3 Tax=Nocardioides TaxID=1839 RepID=A0ABW0ZPQ4_9ACTN